MLTKKGRAVFTPEPETPSVIAGSLCRFVVALCGAFGVCLLLNDSFRFTGRLDMLFVFVVCAVCSLIAYCIAASRFVDRKLYIGLTVFLLFVLFLLINGGIGVTKFFYYAPVTAWNRAITALSDSGFSSLSYFMVNAEGTDPRATDAVRTAKIAYVTLCAVICFVFVHSTVRKVRLMPPVIAAAAVMTVCFTYNMMNENFAFLCIVASGVGLLTLKYCNAFTAVKTPDGAKDKDHVGHFRRASITGAAGLVAAALVFAVGAYPAKTFTEPIGELKAVESIIAAARSYLYGYISGERFTDTNFASVSVSSTPIKPTSRVFENIRLFTVRSQTGQPIYLRSWIGEDFSYGRWSIAHSPAVSDEYTPEDTSELFYTVLGINENTITEDYKFDDSHADLGFVTSYVSLANLGFGTDMIYLPSRYSSYYGLCEYSLEPTFAKFEGGYSVKHNGMINLFKMSAPSYATVAHLPYYQAPNFTYRMNRAIEEYRFTVASLQNLPFYWSNVKKVTAEEVEMIKKSAKESGVRISSTNIINSIASMSPSALDSLKTKINLAVFETLSANTYYTSVPASEAEYIYSDVRAALGDMADLFFPDNTGSGMTAVDYPIYSSSSYFSSSVVVPQKKTYDFDTVYRAVYKIVSYLADNTEYTLEPYGYNDRMSYIYQFLHTAKNGYCTQYASAAVMLLRALGLPARYVEGFKTGDLNKFGGTYRYVVRDNDAHAWVEVYIEGPGWMTFEATEPMLDSMYGTGPSEYHPVTPGTDTGFAHETFEPDTDFIDTDVPVTRPADDTGTDTEPATTGEGEGPTEVPDLVIPKQVIVIAAAAFVLLTLIFAYLAYRKKKRDKLISDLKKAADGQSDDPYADTVRFCAYIFKVLALLGQKRQSSELMSDFADRANEALGTDYLRKATDAASKTVFAGTADKGDCKKAAECALELQKTARGKLKGFSKFWNTAVRKIV